MFNPNFREFCEKNPDKGMMGMFWSLYWRFFLCVSGIYIVIVLFLAVLGSLLN